MEGESFSLTYLNQTARQWFQNRLPQQSEQQVTFEELFPEAKLPRLLKRCAKGLKAEFKIEPTLNQGIPISIVIKPFAQGMLLEARDDTPLLEVQQMLASYSELIEKKNKHLAREQRRVERLLYNILPDKCVQQLREHGYTTPERFSDVSVLFLDFVGFTELSQKVSTKELFEELNDIFTSFDTIIAQHRCERIKTIGDAYLAVCGMPHREADHAQLISCAALKIRAYIQERNQRAQYTWRCRIGIHSGEVTGGVVGRLKYIYDIFGDGVNTASRMESYSEPMKINISSALRARLSPQFHVVNRGRLLVKGKGEIEMFFLEGVDGEPCADRLIESPSILDPQDTIDTTPIMLRPYQVGEDE